jgi:hypothetical protein
MFYVIYTDAWEAQYFVGELASTFGFTDFFMLNSLVLRYWIISLCVIPLCFSHESGIKTLTLCSDLNSICILIPAIFISKIFLNVVHENGFDPNHKTDLFITHPQLEFISPLQKRTQVNSIKNIGLVSSVLNAILTIIVGLSCYFMSILSSFDALDSTVVASKICGIISACC